MKTLALTLSITLVGCGNMVSQQYRTVLDNQFIDRVVYSCPTSEPLAHRAKVLDIVNQYNEDQDADTAAAAFLDACPGLSDEQRRGYWALVQAAGVDREYKLQTAARAERLRRSKAIQDAGRTMMETSRTDNLDRIRRDQANRF